MTAEMDKKQLNVALALNQAAYTASRLRERAAQMRKDADGLDALAESLQDAAAKALD